MEPSEVWALGDYGVVGDLWSAAARDVVGSLPVAGRDVLDLATGTGAGAIAAAERGAASVVGLDVTPSLLAEAERRAAAAGVRVRWVEADVLEVPLPDDAADVTLSTFGLVFAADPARALAEALRVTRPGGPVVFTSWSPNGLFGKVRQALARHFPDAPEPWHETAEGIRQVTDGVTNGVVDQQAEIEERHFELRCASAEEFVDLLERYSAPILLGARTLGDAWPQARADLLDAVRGADADPDREGGGYLARVSYWCTTLTPA